jgi:lipopolysaccharide biosynthesis protein
MIRDAWVYTRQVLRDCGFTVRAARQIAKMAVRTASGRSPGPHVRGIQRLKDHDFSMGVPFGFASADPLSHFRLAAVCHMFYAELADEFREAFAQVPGELDVMISTDTPDKRDQISAVFAGWQKGSVEIRIVPNRGRDIAPKLIAFSEVYAVYDLLLFVHSKRTIRRRNDGSTWDEGQEWRRYLLHNLVGSAQVVSSILAAFRHDPRLGIILAQHWEPIRDYIDWHHVFLAARDLARRMGLGLTAGHVIDFPSGSMFWARPAALKPMLDLGLRDDDFPVEDGQLDGTLAHVLERLFLFSCEAAGFRWVKVCDVLTTLSPLTVVPIDVPSAIESYYQQHGFQLTASGPPYTPDTGGQSDCKQT